MCADLPNIQILASRKGSEVRTPAWSRRFHIFKISGITAVELLPVFQFDAQDAPAGKVNYWGYAPVSFFAPHRVSKQNLLEIKSAVQALINN